MAIDDALARTREGHGSVLRLYRWADATVSLGRNQPARDHFDRREAARRGIPFVRRPTGGRAVLHHREVTYAAILPVGAMGSLRETYRRLNEALVEGLRGMGVDAGLASPGRSGPALDGRPCFESPAPGEVVLDGRKLVGSAQCRMGRTILQHGSILLTGDQRALETLSAGDDPAPPPATLADALGRLPSWEEAARSVADGFCRLLSGEWIESDPTEEERRVAVELGRRYASSEWTWRR